MSLDITFVYNKPGSVNVSKCVMRDVQADWRWRVYHAQVVHETCPMLPDLRRGAAERLHSDFLTAVQFPHCPHHHVHRIKHQRRRQLRWARER